ncbi:programmed cell death protein 7-like [Pyrgilauda ruficollis]|uniref:programmed cell death protein 7-like n=1 Tax=Pyrgilauda ruficollis TaxID=221976 RepID=UPI001B86D136|nr:programmed cell death protein 7-like [Pyrgilauda ruficollis]
MGSGDSDIRDDFPPKSRIFVNAEPAGRLGLVPYRGHAPKQHETTPFRPYMHTNHALFRIRLIDHAPWRCKPRLHSARRPRPTSTLVFEPRPHGHISTQTTPPNTPGNRPRPFPRASGPAGGAVARRPLSPVRRRRAGPGELRAAALRRPLPAPPLLSPRPRSSPLPRAAAGARDEPPAPAAGPGSPSGASRDGIAPDFLDNL